MCKAFMLSVTLILSSVGFAASANDPLHLAGDWICQGYDSHDGAYKDDTLTLTLDEKNSDFKHNYGAYHFKLAGEGVLYLGEAVANGNMLAIYFANQAKESQTDHGVGIAMITHDLNEKGISNAVLHKFYYESEYMGGGHGSETCVKQNKHKKLKSPKAIQ